MIKMNTSTFLDVNVDVFFLRLLKNRSAAMSDFCCSSSFPGIFPWRP